MASLAQFSANKIRENKEYAFRRFFSDISRMAMSTMANQEDKTLKIKGKVLMGLR